VNFSLSPKFVILGCDSIVSWTQTFEAIVHMSRRHHPVQVVWIFHRIVFSLVLRTVSVMRRVHKAFEAFDDPDQDLA
jgi:hypothetical protein